MLGIMQDWPLTVDKVLDHARLQNGTREIITRRVSGEIVRTTYADVFNRAKQVSNALKAVLATVWRHLAGTRLAIWKHGMGQWVLVLCCTQ